MDLSLYKRVNWWLGLTLTALCFEISRSQHRCLEVNSRQIECMNSLTPSIFLECPTAHTLRILEAFLLRSSTAGCPITRGSADCLHSNVTSVALSQCRAGTSSACRIAFSSPSSSPGGCDDQSFPGNYYVTVKYRCQPEFSLYLNGSAWAISLCEKDVRNGSLININSDISGLLGNYIYNSSCSMSLFLPRYTQATIRANFFYKKPQPVSSCGQYIAIQEGLEDSSPANTFIVCDTKDPAINVPCSAEDRYFRVKYVTNDSSIGVIFVQQVQANYQVLMRIQGGNPPSPAINGEETTATTTTTTTTTTATSITTSATTTTTTPPTTTTSSTSTRKHPTTRSEGQGSTSPNPVAPAQGQSITISQMVGIIVGCIIAAVSILLLIIAVVYARRRKDAKLSGARLDQNFRTPVASSANPMKSRPTTKTEDLTEVYGVRSGKNNFAYVTEFYVDGNQTSKLVVPTKRTNKTVFDV